MRTLIPLLLMAAVCGCSCPKPRMESGEAIQEALTPRALTVVDPRAVDGDTLDAGEHGRVRLIGIDCAEVGEPGADAATKFLAAMVERNTVYLEISPLWPKDVYDRHRAMAYIGVGSSRVCLNSELLRRGLAKPSSRGPEAWDVKAMAAEPAPTIPSNRLDAAGLPDSGRIIVVVTPSGSKYHRSSCRHAKAGARTSLRGAIARGYEPCGSCRPPVVDP